MESRLSKVISSGAVATGFDGGAPVFQEGEAVVCCAVATGGGGGVPVFQEDEAAVCSPHGCPVILSAAGVQKVRGAIPEVTAMYPLNLYLLQYLLQVCFSRIALLQVMSFFLGRTFGLHPYQFTYLEIRLTMEEILYKYIDEGKHKHEEMSAFIREFRTTSELLFKERNNSLSELRFEVNGLSRVIDNALISNYEVKGVTTRRGKTTTQGIHNDNADIHTKEPLVFHHDKPVAPIEVLVENEPQKTKEQVVQLPIELQTPSIPFPRRLRKEKEEAHQRKFLENLKRLHVNLLFIEALAQIPKYAKFLKILLTNKARLEEACTVMMNERCLAVLLNKLPSKEKDPRSLREPKPTRMSLELAIRSIQYPRGIIENVHIKVDKFVLPIDFVILDMPEDSRVLIILERPFLETARAMLDRPPAEDDECYGLDDLDDTINTKTQELLGSDQSNLFSLKDLEKLIYQSDLESFTSIENKSDDNYDIGMPIRRINSVNTQYSEAQKIAGTDEVNSEHLYSASANEIDEKKPKLKDLPHHLEDAYLHGSKSFPIIISSKLSEKEKMLLLQDGDARTDEVNSEHLYSVSANEIDEKKLELKDLPHHLEYAYLHGSKSFPIIISSKLSEKEKMLLLQVLEKCKGAIASKMRLNPNVQDVVKNKIVKLLDSGLIYPISDSSWVSPIHVVPKKGGMTVVLNDNNELIPSRTIIGWRVCIDYHKLNDATRKDHFRLTFIDQMLEHLSGNEYYCFLDGFSRFFQISIAPEDQEKTTLTCPYGTFAYRRMSFGLCNTPATFQRCMTAIFHDIVEDFMEVFMDVFSVFGKFFNCCLANLDKILARCEETNLVLN
ncbi:DNA-directed DNA polymerase [Tanacetum coccineum]